MKHARVRHIVPAKSILPCNDCGGQWFSLQDFVKCPTSRRPPRLRSARICQPEQAEAIWVAPLSVQIIVSMWLITEFQILLRPVLWGSTPLGDLLSRQRRLPKGAYLFRAISKFGMSHVLLAGRRTPAGVICTQPDYTGGGPTWNGMHSIKGPLSGLTCQNRFTPCKSGTVVVVPFSVVGPETIEVHPALLYTANSYELACGNAIHLNFTSPMGKTAPGLGDFWMVT